ncbi:metal ABC transporter permease [Aliibacillus thermotolerans]|uniref:Metal ABC transporter permease n=1 Tax=Aliibacillus thermotolerans TaxID=1834418 RepID=A0ABW0UBL5_9BACI|nr:metal ABC transporter permease [Aliibacillus thermotolerans]MDA3130714.1 iron chelate uptake ABC transporter family permease subunit [Aliibacillus thermotolerans]
MFELSLSFIERGIVAAMIVGVIAPLVGAMLFVRRSSVVSESLSHVTLTGVSAGVLLAQVMETIPMNPLYIGFGFALVGSLLIEKLRQTFHHFQDLAAPMILSAGIGLSAVLMSISTAGYNEWYDYLFGSIISVSPSDLRFIMITAFIVLLIFYFFQKELIIVSFDEEFAKVSGVSTKGMNFLFSILVALVISMSMKVVGILLVGALISLPVAASLKVARSFRQLLVWSVILGEVAVMSGVYFSYHYSIAPGGMIVVMSVLLLLLFLLLPSLMHRKQEGSS